MSNEKNTGSQAMDSHGLFTQFDCLKDMKETVAYQSRGLIVPGAGKANFDSFEASEVRTSRNWDMEI